MAINLTSLPVAIYFQSGNGVPTHISPKGTEYTDLDTAIVYINKDGIASWAEFLDSTFVITGGTNSYFTGGTVTGPTNFLNGVTANTISATTYYGLPTDVRVTGGTYSTGTATFTNNTGGTFSVTGLTTPFTGGTVAGPTIFTGGLSANTISATTYYNLPNDLPVSGTTGQILAKNSNTNYDVIWIDNYASELKHIVKAGEAISIGQAVYVSSANGTNMIVSKASNTSEATSSKTLGLLAQDLALNGQGFVITEGLLAGLNTGSANAGDAVWLGTNGNLIFGLLNKPVAPAHLVYIGVVTRAQTNNGEIFVKVQNGFELNEIHDILITGVTNGDLISYNSSSSLWKNSKTLDGSYKVTGVLSATTISATTYFNLPTDIRVTGGTYAAGTAIFTNNTGGTFNVTGYSLGNITGNGSVNYVPKFSGTTGISNSLLYDAGYGIGINTTNPNTALGVVINASYSNTVDLQNTNSLGGSAIDMYDNLGNYIGSVGGELGHKSIGFDSYSLSGISFSISSNKKAVITSNGLGINVLQPIARLHVSGTTLINGDLTANTVSATTYFNLPTDVRVTGATYSNNVFTFTNNTGGTFNTLFNTITGLTVNGNLTVTGSTISPTHSGITFISTGTYGSMTMSSSNNQAMIVFSGSNTVGGTGYTDFLKVTNTAAGATNIDKTFRVSNNGTLEIVNNGYSGLSLSLTDSGSLNIPGNMTASGYTNLPNSWLYAVRNSNQTISSGNWGGRDIVFNDYSSNNFTYNNSNGFITLKAGKTYRITARLAWSAAAIYVLKFRLYNITTSSYMGPTAEIIQSTNGTNNISDSTLELIWTPSATDTLVVVKMTSDTNALSGEYIRSDLNTQLIIQQIA